jgi:hypothetical protein
LAGMCTMPVDGDGSGSAEDGGPGATSFLGPTTGSTGSDETSIADDCLADEVCAPATPEGWSGPVLAMTAADEPPACPAALGETVTTGHAGLTASPADCGCSCGLDPAGCPPVLAELSNEPECAATSLPVPIEAGECVSYPVELIPEGGSAFQPAARLATPCLATARTTLPPAEWASHVSACALATTGPCADGECAAIADPIAGAALCVWRDGDHACPLAGYTQPFVFHRSHVDDRGCTPCECEVLSADGEAPCRTRLYGNGDCTGEAIEDVPSHEEACIALEPGPAGFSDVSATVVTSDAVRCSARQPSAPTGAATPTDAFTLCCMP